LIVEFTISDMYLHIMLTGLGYALPLNFRFSPCIFKVNHFHWPTNALNCI